MSSGATQIIEGNKIINCKNGIHYTSNKNVNIRNNVFKDNDMAIKITEDTSSILVNVTDNDF
jgi:parallel beta-helix repeat protein